MAKRFDRDPSGTLRIKTGEAVGGTPETAPGVTQKDGQELLHELSEYQIELEMQNEELRASRLEIEESRSEYADLYDFAPVGYMTLDDKGHITELNLTAAGLLGIDRRRLVQKPFFPFVQADYRDTFFMHHGRALQSTEKHTCDLILKRKDGSLFPAHLESIAARTDGARSIRTVLMDSSKWQGSQTAGTPAGAGDEYDDLRRRLDEAEQTIEAIRNGEIDAIVTSDKDGSRVYTLEGPDHPYRNIVETMNAGAVTIDQEGTIFYSNAAFAHMTGIPLQGLIGSSFKDLVIADDEPSLSGFLGKTRRGEDTTEEIRLRGREGTVFVKLAGSSRMAHDVERTSVVITDISALKSAEESFRKAAQSAERERDRVIALIDNMQNGVWFADVHGRILLANAIAKSQLAEVGIDPDALFDSPSSALLSGIDVLTPDGEPLEAGPLMRLFQGKLVRPMEIAIRNRTTGQLFYRSISASPILDSKKQIEGVIAIVRDVTAEKRAAGEKARLEEQLRQSQKLEAIGTLAGGIAHDFNNMLAVIMGNAELALDEAEGNGGSRQNIEQIVKASKRARDLVKQILAFSRKTEHRRTLVKLRHLVEETYTLLRGSLPSTIAIDLDLGTGSDTVLGDSTQIQQVLLNLAMNAAHAMRGKPGALTVSLCTLTFQHDGPFPDGEMSPGGYVRLTVKDTGKGMTEKVKRRIFEPFFTTKIKSEGTGMGLAVVYGIVKGHGGAIAVESQPGKGSTFTVFLPLARGEAKVQAREGGRVPRGRERILVVDDEPLVVEMTSQMLRNLGYEVTTAENGVEALHMFLDQPHGFDLVITDQTMPGMTGIDLAERMLETREDLPIILFTGYSEVVSPEQAKAMGVRAFIMKPVARREIARTVRRVLDTDGER